MTRERKSVSTAEACSRPANTAMSQPVLMLFKPLHGQLRNRIFYAPDDEKLSGWSAVKRYFAQLQRWCLCCPLLGIKFLILIQVKRAARSREEIVEFGCVQNALRSKTFFRVNLYLERDRLLCTIRESLRF